MVSCNLAQNELKTQIINAASSLSKAGMLPATSGNLSIREGQSFWITVSGRDKGNLSENDFLELAIDSDQEDWVFDSELKPSAEVLLHQQLYRFSEDIKVVLHVHANTGVIISKLKSNEIKLSNYELLKALEGVSTHKHIETVPVFPNTQNIKLLANQVQDYMSINPNIHGYLIEGHGLYTWGKDINSAMRHIEVFDNLFSCELELIKCQH